ncbi:MAG: hypothetical protein V1845_02640 [bacterium]
MKSKGGSKKWVWKIAVAGGFLLFLIASIFYLIVFTSFAKISNIKVEGTKEVDAKSIEEISRSIIGEKFFNKIPKDNLILFPQKKIIGAIIRAFPEIKSVVLTEKPFEHSAIIKIEERQASAIWCRVPAPENEEISTSSVTQAVQASLPSAESCFFVDSEGFIFKNAPILSGGAVPTVYDKTSQDLDLRRTVANPERLKFILAVKKELAGVNMILTDFIIASQTLGDLEILTPEGWRILLDTTKSPSSQINALKRVLEEKIKEKRALLEYVDLRVEDRVYYKYWQ